MNPKQRAAEAAIEHLHNETVIGLGTGSTADYFLVALGEALKTGRLRNVRGVPTSDQTERRAAHLGVPLVTLQQVAAVDVTVDGADEVDPNLDLIKGLGGALLREKIVAQNSRALIIIADASKRVSRLGEKAPVPVEVTTFAHEVQVPFLTSLGAQPKLRRKPDGSTFVTDNGNLIYDCRFAGGIPDARALADALQRRAGVVETGLFLNMARIAIVADESRVQTLRRPS